VEKRGGMRCCANKGSKYIASWSCDKVKIRCIGKIEDTIYMAKTGKVDRVRIMNKFSDKSKRIVASPKLDKVSEKEQSEFQEGQSVELLIGDRTDIG
jgi:hypothetical protein